MKNADFRHSRSRSFSRPRIALCLAVLFLGILFANDYEPYVPPVRQEQYEPPELNPTRFEPVRVEPLPVQTSQIEPWRPIAAERMVLPASWTPDYSPRWFAAQAQGLRAGLTADVNKYSAGQMGKAGAYALLPIGAAGVVGKVYDGVNLVRDAWHSVTHWGKPITNINEGIDRFTKPVVGAIGLTGSWAAPAAAWAPFIAKAYAGACIDAMSRIPSLSGGPTTADYMFSGTGGSPTTTVRIVPVNYEHFDGFTRTIQTSQRTITETRMPDPMDGYSRTTTGSYRVVQTTNVPNIRQFEQRWNVSRTQNHTAPVVPRTSWIPVQAPKVEIPRTNYRWTSPASVTPSPPRTDWSRVQSNYTTMGASGNYGSFSRSYAPSIAPTTAYNNYQSYLRSFTPTYNYIQNQYNSYRPLWSTYSSFNSYRPYTPTYTPPLNSGGIRR